MAQETDYEVEKIIKKDFKVGQVSKKHLKKQIVNYNSQCVIKI